MNNDKPFFKNPFAAIKYFTFEMHNINANIDSLLYTYEIYLKKSFNEFCNLYYILTGYKEYRQFLKLNNNLPKKYELKDIIRLMHQSLCKKPYIDSEPILKLMQNKRNEQELKELLDEQKKIDEIFRYAQKFNNFVTKEEAWFYYLLFRENYFNTDLNKIIERKNNINLDMQKIVIYTNLDKPLIIE